MPSKPLKRAPLPKASQEIKLQNPVAQHYGSFVVGNAQYCDRVVEEHSHAGQHLVLCGAGPSLAEHAAEWCPQGDQVWGCNSAMTYLAANGRRVTHAFAVDQTTEMVNEWHTAPDVDYLLASTVHPHLVEYLLDKERRLTFFHNFVGIQQRPVAYALCNACGTTTDHDATACPKCQSSGMTRGACGYEDWLYATLYPGTIRAGSGLNAVTRAIDVARFMGFSKITVLGADCAIRLKSKPPEGAEPGSPEHLHWLRTETVMHADGGSALASNATPVTLGGEIDSGTPDETIREGQGRWWETKPDLIITAVWLAQMAKKLPGLLNLVGDTLPNALALKGEKYLSSLPKMVDSNGNDIQFTIEDEADVSTV